MIYTDNLESARLTTRFLTNDDVTVWTEFFNSPSATEFIPNDKKLSAKERAQEWIDAQVKRYRENRFGLQALITKETGEFVGMCGLMTQDVNDKQEVEVGYHLLPAYWGKGYATEAAKLFRDLVFENKLADSVVSIIHPINEVSKRVAVRNGMQLVETDAVWRGNKYDLFRITRREWEELNTFYWSTLFSSF